MMDTLGSVICYPKYKTWEVEDAKSTVSLDMAQLQASPTSLVMEGLHQVAFRQVKIWKVSSKNVGFPLSLKNWVV